MNYKFTFSIDNDSIMNKIYSYTEIKSLLENHLSENDYSNQINAIFTIYQIFADLRLRENYIETLKYRKKNKEYELYLNLNYNQLLQANEEESIGLLAETYLKGIEKYLIGRKDFDGNKFYADVKQLFTENGILKNGNRVER